MANVDKLNKALEDADLLYSDLVSAANIIVEDYTKDVDEMIRYISDNVESMTTEMLRIYMMKLSLKSFSFSEIKEKSALKAECAETLRKEAYAKNFNSTEGSVAFRENTATINSNYESLAGQVYELVANLFKVKLDEIHRVVSTINSVLLSRMQEAKLAQGTLDTAFDK